MKKTNVHRWRRLAQWVGTTGLVFQMGSCQIGDITTTTTVDGRELIINLIRGAILDPIDSFITNGINDAFSTDGG